MRITDLIAASQLKAIQASLMGEENQFFADKLKELQGIVDKMPRPYETDGQGWDAIAYLHYFKDGCDWYITEMDSEAEPNQCFGLADMGEPELGYISIVELIENGVELDLHWTPKKLSEKNEV